MDAGLLARVADAVAAADPRQADIDLQNRLRLRFEGLRIVVCNDDDVAPNVPAALETPRCRLYYLDANDHCVRLTREPEAASGLVVGLRADDGN
ncbi:MAG: hypothetical protein HZB40_20390 [Rhodocyclales bacterium]|nr:hypothetical protein [Rhodocyclales bacterium]